MYTKTPKQVMKNFQRRERGKKSKKTYMKRLRNNILR